MSYVLLEGRFRPTTDDTGFLEAPCDLVLQIMREWRKENHVREQVTPIIGGVADALQSLLPLQIARSRSVIVPTANGWTAYWSNGWQGTDCASFVRHLYRRIKRRSIRVVHAPQNLRTENGKSKGTFGATMLEVFTFVDGTPKNDTRGISASNDGGRWVFDNFGTPFDFEDVERYSAKRIRDRFTPEMLVEYLSHFNLRPFDADFYMPDPKQPAYLFQNLHFRAIESQSYSPKEIREML